MEMAHCLVLSELYSSRVNFLGNYLAPLCANAPFGWHRKGSKNHTHVVFVFCGSNSKRTSWASHIEPGLLRPQSILLFMLHSTTYNRRSLVYWKRMCYVRLWLWRQLWGLIWVFLGFFLGCFLLIFHHIAAKEKILGWFLSLGGDLSLGGQLKLRESSRSHSFQ